jgi:hypothetical protein
MTDPMRRIREADVRQIGFSYCHYAGLPWLSWPIQTTDMDVGEWFGWIVRAVAGAPVCGRTEADCWRELRAIPHVGLSRLLARIAPSEPAGVCANARTITANDRE